MSDGDGDGVKLIAGRMRHRDSAGNQGLLQNNGVQWMTAGSGLIHSELPEQEEGRMEGFRLWLNLPAVDKMTAPGYRDIPTGAIPELRLPGATFEQALPPGHNAFVYVYRGDLEIDRGDVRTRVPRERMAVLANAPDRDGVRVQAGADGARALVVAGGPLNEPIAQHGPFVMNRQDEIFQAVEDFRAGKFGVPPGR